MKKALIAELRKASFWMAFFAAFFILMYSGVVLLTKFAYTHFRGFVPDADKVVLRVIFYLIAAGSVYYFTRFNNKRFSRERLRSTDGSAEDVLTYLILTVAFSLAIAESPLICGFLLFFLGAMYADFFILAAVTFLLILRSIPSVAFLEERL